MFVIAGLGNPGKEYEGTRHNIGRDALGYFAHKNNFPQWEKNKKNLYLYSKENIGKENIKLVMPETFMNNSGKALIFVKNRNKIQPENIIVIHDDLDLPIGVFKISFNKNSGGHKGVESIIKSLKTKSFIRIRIGISPLTPMGKLNKPKGAKRVLDWVMKEPKMLEKYVLRKVFEQVNEAVKVIIKEGRVKAKNKYNK